MRNYLSTNKIYAMFFTLAFVCFITVFGSTRAYAAVQTIDDDAEILTSEEITSLEGQCSEIKATYDIDMFIITTNSTYGATHKDYLSECKVNSGFSDCVLLLICMDPDYRGFCIESFGTSQDYLTNSRLDDLNKEIKPLLSNSSYNLAIETFIDSTATFLDKKASPDGMFYQLWFQILISLGIGGVIVLIMALNAGGKVTVNESTYLDQGSSRILSQHDHYIRTTVTQSKKSNDNNNSSGGGTASDGSSYNSSGGSF